MTLIMCFSFFVCWNQHSEILASFGIYWPFPKCILVLLANMTCALLNQLFSKMLCRATTHTDLVVRAKKLGLEVKVIHNASVMNAIGVCGLQLYRYGETVSMPFFTDTWRPDSFYPKIQRNRQLGLHTLCLLGQFYFLYVLVFFQFAM